jgi:hypothetical protein
MLPGPNAVRIADFAVKYTDVPLKTREEWLHALAQKVPPLVQYVNKILKKVHHSRARAQYDLFFDVQPLVDFVHSGELENVVLEVLRAKLIIALRLYTMARSADLQNIPPVLFQQQGLFFIRLYDKMGKERLLSVAGRTLTLLCSYLAVVSAVPCLVLFRHLHDFHMGLSAERIAKESLL